MVRPRSTLPRLRRNSSDDSGADTVHSVKPADNAPVAAPPLTSKTKLGPDHVIDLKRRRDELNARVAELQWDLGGLVYEMAIRDRIRVDIIVKRADELQDADA